MRPCALWRDLPSAPDHASIFFFSIEQTEAIDYRLPRCSPLHLIHHNRLPWPKKKASPPCTPSPPATHASRSSRRRHWGQRPLHLDNLTFMYVPCHLPCMHRSPECSKEVNPETVSAARIYARALPLIATRLSPGDSPARRSPSPRSRPARASPSSPGTGAGHSSRPQPSPTARTSPR